MNENFPVLQVPPKASAADLYCKSSRVQPRGFAQPRSMRTNNTTSVSMQKKTKKKGGADTKRTALGQQTVWRAPSSRSVLPPQPRRQRRGFTSRSRQDIQRRETHTREA
ncbi:hypothetical protein AGOR_G00231740 [Albula goreensis]|uniref:Uncharacterized protein n=1 Tax=Albula goreensis TaxID=1534307 RepID=A0A8T3CHS6_9TELE|nr:hypothetical protein AGOR_G00231740 [Albula goreensis]